MLRILIIAFLININFIFSQDKGLDYYRNQEFEAAKNYYESIILESDNNPEAQLGKGSSSFQLGDYDSAKGAFEQSLRSNDNITIGEVVDIFEKKLEFGEIHYEVEYVKSDIDTNKTSKENIKIYKEKYA